MLERCETTILEVLNQKTMLQDRNKGVFVEIFVGKVRFWDFFLSVLLILINHKSLETYQSSGIFLRFRSLNLVYSGILGIFVNFVPSTFSILISTNFSKISLGNSSRSGFAERSNDVSCSDWMIE